MGMNCAVINELKDIEDLLSMCRQVWILLPVVQ